LQHVDTGGGPRHNFLNVGIEELPVVLNFDSRRHDIALLKRDSNGTQKQAHKLQMEIDFRQQKVDFLL
jgi:hypothetical protein